MIRRFLVISPKRIFFSTTKSDFEDSPKVKLVDLKMPLDVFHQIEEKIKDLDFLTTQATLQTEYSERYKEIFSKVNRFAVEEKDRIWLFEQSKK